MDGCGRQKPCLKVSGLTLPVQIYFSIHCIGIIDLMEISYLTINVKDVGKLRCYVLFWSLGFGRGHLVEGKMSRVESTHFILIQIRFFQGEG